MRWASVAFDACVSKVRKMRVEGAVMPHDHHDDQNHDHGSDRTGAQQPSRFDPARAARLDDPGRFAYLPVADVLALLDIPRGATLCDFGTGTGTYAIEIAQQRPDVRILALDEQPEMLAFLRAKPAARALANIVPMLPGDLEPERGRIARVLGLNVLHEFGDDALASVRTLLAPDGRALFIDWNGAVERPHGPPAEHLYTPESAAARLIEHGYAVTAHAPFAYHYALSVTPLPAPSAP